MEHSKNFEKVKNYYDKGLWNIDKVHSAVGKWITEDEYKEITTFTYPSKEADPEPVEEDPEEHEADPDPDVAAVPEEEEREEKDPASEDGSSEAVDQEGDL